MAPATLSLLAFLALTVWRFVFAGLWHRRLVREIEAPQQRRNGFLELRLHIFDRADVGVLAGNLENGSDGLDPVARKYRAQSHLRRVVALTGATQMGNGYVLDVGTTRFEVRDRLCPAAAGPDRSQMYIRGNLLLLRAQRDARSGPNCYRAAAAQEQSSAL